MVAGVAGVGGLPRLDGHGSGGRLGLPCTRVPRAVGPFRGRHPGGAVDRSTPPRDLHRRSVRPAHGGDPALVSRPEEPCRRAAGPVPRTHGARGAYRFRRSRPPGRPAWFPGRRRPACPHPCGLQRPGDRWRRTVPGRAVLSRVGRSAYPPRESAAPPSGAQEQAVPLTDTRAMGRARERTPPPDDAVLRCRCHAAVGCRRRSSSV